MNMISSKAETWVYDLLISEWSALNNTRVPNALLLIDHLWGLENIGVYKIYIGV